MMRQSMNDALSDLQIQAVYDGDPERSRNISDLIDQSRELMVNKKVPPRNLVGQYHTVYEIDAPSPYAAMREAEVRFKKEVLKR